MKTQTNQRGLRVGSVSDYRNNEANARRVAEYLFPDPDVRQQCLNFLADAIEYAHGDDQNSGAWAVTLDSEGEYIRLNVGGLEACALFHDTVHLILDATHLSPQDYSTMQQQGMVYVQGPTQYVKAACSMWWDVPASALPRTLPLFQQSFHSLIDVAVTTVKWRTNYHIHHAPGVLTYLRNLLQRDLPDSLYDINIIIDQTQQQLNATTNPVERQAVLERLKQLRQIERRMERKR